MPSDLSNNLFFSGNQDEWCIRMQEIFSKHITKKERKKVSKKQFVFGLKPIILYIFKAFNLNFKDMIELKETLLFIILSKNQAVYH